VQWKRQKTNVNLSLDSFAIYMTSKVQVTFSRCNTEIDFLPEGFTSRLQVMDVGANKPFKGYIRDEFDF
jgi:DDE superfamily endonuclease